MRTQLFKQKQNKRFNYTPRYFKGKNTGNPYAFDSVFSKYRETPNSTDFGAHWKEARQGSRHRGNRSFSIRLFLIIGILVLLSLFVLDFDISLFIS